MASAANTTVVNDMIMSYEDTSWQDVYASYGCSLSMDASDDDG